MCREQPVEKFVEHSQPFDQLFIARIQQRCFNQMDQLVREGFPDMSRGRFIAMFCEHMGGERDQTVNRIEFRYVPGGRLEKTGIDPPV